MNAVRRWVALVALVGMLCAVMPLAPLAATEPTGSVLVRMPAGVYRAADLTPLHLWDYGSFAWLELTAADYARLQASGLEYQAYPSAYTLRLGEQSFDPAVNGPVLPAGWDGVRGDTPDLHLVQMVGPSRAQWLDMLQGSGLGIVQYIHPFTYVVWGDLGAVERAGGFDFARWTGPFAPAYRVLPHWRNLPGREVMADVLIFRGADTDAVVRAIESLGGRMDGRGVLNQTWEIAGFALSGARLQAAAQIPGVYSIQLRATDGGLRGEMSNQVNVNNVDAGNMAFPGYLTWLAQAGVDGSGVVIANVDGGVEDTHTDLANRIVPCSGQTCGGSAASAHGTHTAGIMAADGTSGNTDPYGFLRGLGMAPGANLVEQVYNPFFTWPNGMLLLMTQSYTNGAYLSGNSWGPASSPQGYDNDTMQVDIGTRDADANTPGNQQFLYVLSIMNGNGGTSSQGTPDEAKNIFTIGSTKMQTSGGAQIPDINDLSSNSAHGPCLDGRKIPHLVAPGCNVDSTVTGNSYGLMCGTSMSSPHVSGASALFVEYYRNLFGVDPTPAMVKAAFLPVAHDLNGFDDADGNPMGHPFDSKQGWGRMDTAAVVSPTAVAQYFDAPQILDNTGEEWVKTLVVADPSKPMRIMLVWTDAPGHGLGGTTPAWNNDLDLVVEWDGDTYYGNDFAADGWSQPGGTADYQNNTEGVFLGPTASGAATVRVVASNISSDGIPGQGDITDQDFSLVCWNCYQGADFTLHAEPDDFELCAPALVTSTITVGQVLTYTEDVTLALLDVPVGIGASLVPAVVTPPGQALLTLDVTGAIVPGAYTIVVSGTAGVTNVHTVKIDLLISADLPAAPALYSPANGAAGQPYQDLDFVWGLLPQVADYDFQLDDDPFFVAPLVSVTNLPTATYTVETGLSPAGCYFWRAMGTNGCGEGPWAEPFHFGTVLLDQVFLDDMEGSPANWAATGLWHITSVPTDTCAEAHSGASSWYYGQEPACDYNAGTNAGTLTMLGPVDLSAALAPASLRFWSWEQTEDYSGYDTRKVYLSSNGSTWMEVWDSSDNAAAWYQVELDVSSYVGGNLYVRFEFDTVDGSFNSYRGWYVDDVEVLAGMAPSNPPSVLSITPDTGSTYSETPVTIGGTGFSATPFALLGGTPLLTVTYVNSATLDAVVPAGMEPGLYDLTVVNPDCQDDVLQGAFTVVAECISPTVALDSDSPVELGSPMYFTATLLSGTPTYTFTWDFGGAGSGEGLDTATPVYTYTAAGSYTVTLRVENACGTDTAALVVEVYCDAPAVEIASDSPVELGQGMQFTSTVSGTGPFAYAWDFGDGLGGSAAAHPVYTYTAAGSYTVTLLVTGSCGTDVDGTVVEVLEPCVPPLVEASAGSPVELGQAMPFTATLLSGTAPLSYSWDFGDGVGSSVEANPVYTYAAAGTYTVTLLVENDCGTDTAALVVEVVCVTPAASFASDSPVELGQGMQFTSTVSGTGPFSYSWDFGDGVGSSMAANPAYTYAAAGTYTVTLAVEGACGSAGYSAVVVVEEARYYVYLPLVFKNAAP